MPYYQKNPYGTECFISYPFHKDFFISIPTALAEFLTVIVTVTI